MTVVIGRSGWGALPPNRPVSDMTRCDAIVLHHTVTAQPSTIDDARQQVQQIDRQHLGETDDNGHLVYSDIAYNLVVGPDCIFVARGPYASDGATDADPTTNTCSISLLGDYRSDLVTNGFRRALDDAVSLARGVWGRIPVRPHHDYYATTCPGPNVDAIIDQFNDPNHGDDDMTDTDIDKLSTAIVDKYFAHPLTLNSGLPPKPTDTNVHGWYVFMHQELNEFRLTEERAH